METHYEFRVRAPSTYLATGAWAESKKVKSVNLFDFSYLHLSLV